MSDAPESPLGRRLIRQDVVALWPNRFELAQQNRLSLAQIEQMDSAGLAFLLQLRKLNPALELSDPSDRAQALAQVHGVPGCFTRLST